MKMSPTCDAAWVCGLRVWGEGGEGAADDSQWIMQRRRIYLRPLQSSRLSRTRLRPQRCSRRFHRATSWAPFFTRFKLPQCGEFFFLPFFYYIRHKRRARTLFGIATFNCGVCGVKSFFFAFFLWRLDFFFLLLLLSVKDLFQLNSERTHAN